jgi:hypothetical protein
MPAVGRAGRQRQHGLRALAGQIGGDAEHADDGEQRGQGDDAEAGQRVVAAPGGCGHADAHRQHQRHGHRPRGDGAAVPGQADDRRQRRLLTAAVLVMLYPLCRWYAGYKQTHSNWILRLI